jgi:hypothetical protein
MRRLLELTISATALAFVSTVAAGGPAQALPRPATGSNCSSDWVNNAGAMACFIQGEDEARNGSKHPHYVACLNGDIFCCVDTDRGQNCEAQARSAATQADQLKAILSAHKTMLMSLGRWTAKPQKGVGGVVTAPRKSSPQ